MYIYIYIYINIYIYIYIYILRVYREGGEKRRGEPSFPLRNDREDPSRGTAL